MRGEEQEADSGENFENSNWLAGIGIGNAAHRLGECLVIHQFAAVASAHAVALVPVHQVRRGVDVDRMA